MASPVHIGLMGHIDSGKTKIAECLSEIVSTAGLDKHPQAKERGITIDLGFSFFSLGENNKYMVTIVDAPGHANLIRSVVACANIIDLALVVIDGEKGPQVQTGEHLMILHSLGIRDIIFVINKIDLISPEQVQKLTQKLHQIIKGLNLTIFDIIPVSAKEKKGIKELRESLTRFFDTHQEKLSRKREAPFLFLFDHHFIIKGKGTILTGTALSGRISVGESLTILPENIEVKVKSIQKHKESVEKAEAGDRAGIAVSGLEPDQVKRGSFAVSNPKDYAPVQFIEGQIILNSAFKYSIAFGSEITINSGMQVFQALIYPFEMEQEKRIPKDIPALGCPLAYSCVVYLKEPQYLIQGAPMLVSRLDLPPTKLRIAGRFDPTQNQPKEPPMFYVKKIRKGKVKAIRPEEKIAIIEGLASSIKGAELLIGSVAEPPFGKIVETFGTKGNLKVEINALPENPQELVGKEIELVAFKQKHIYPD
jgi:selenocysteine-specific elongation factor